MEKRGNAHPTVKWEGLRSFSASVSFCGATYGGKLKLLLQFHQVKGKTDETHEHEKQEPDFALGSPSFAGNGESSGFS